MPRHAREKSCDSVYHVMVRSISDTPLFKSREDKDMFLHLIQKYKQTFMFKVYAYSLMDTHAHILIDSNGADISDIMHGINQCYAMYFNRVHKRRGHLFMDRFKSVIKHDDTALINASAYINKNAKDIKGYKGVEEKYRYSSFGIYAGLFNDDYEILDQHFILELFSRDIILAKTTYIEFVHKYDDESETQDMEFSNELAQYRSERRIIIRDAEPEKVVDFVADYTMSDKKYIAVKYIKDVNEMKALCVFLMRCLCDMKERDICRFMGNITQSYAAKLYHTGLKLIDKEDKYGSIIQEFLKKRAS